MNKEKVLGKLNKFFESKKFRIFLYVFGSLFIIIFVFQAGMTVGFRKASFGHDWGDNYERNFGPNMNKHQMFKDNLRDMPNAHGAIGKIMKVEFPNIVVLDKDQTEKIIIINDKTNILERKEKINKENLTVDKFIVVIGNPNDNGQIEAKLIRVIPSPEKMMEMTGPMNDKKLFNEINDRNI